jgi:hypothetical protein
MTGLLADIVLAVVSPLWITPHSVACIEGCQVTALGSDARSILQQL